MRHDNFIHLAEKVASLSTHYNKIGAVITRKRRVISVGTNKNKLHAKQINPHTDIIGSNIHAELDAIIKAPYFLLEGSNIYVVRLFKNNSMGLARPCKSCINILKQYRIKYMIYSTNESWEKEKV
jgi:deoxycytidylate deaminase